MRVKFPKTELLLFPIATFPPPLCVTVIVPCRLLLLFPRLIPAAELSASVVVPATEIAPAVPVLC